MGFTFVLVLNIPTKVWNEAAFAGDGIAVRRQGGFSAHSADSQVPRLRDRGEWRPTNAQAGLHSTLVFRELSEIIA
jgi:hypothetical protein